MKKVLASQSEISLYAGIKPEKLPREWFPFYVIYKYNWAKSTSIVGFGTDLEADRFQQEMLTHRNLERCEIFGHYPRELLELRDGKNDNSSKGSV